MAGMTRGPLPAEIYWRRRALMIALALLLVFGLSRVLGGGSDGSDPGGGGTAAQAGAHASVTPRPAGATGATGATETPSATPTTKKQLRAAKKAEKLAAEKAAKQAQKEAEAAAASASAAALPDPQGDCADSDVVVTPTIPSPVAGGDVAIDLALTTRFSPACSWKVSAESIALKITSGPDDIWSTQDCPKAVPTQDVVLRRAVATSVQVVWSAKRSNESCSARTSWAAAGFYHVLVAALAGEPTDVQFELTLPVAPQVIVTAQPETDKAGKKAGKNTGKKKGQ